MLFKELTIICGTSTLSVEHEDLSALPSESCKCCVVRYNVGYRHKEQFTWVCHLKTARLIMPFVRDVHNVPKGLQSALGHSPVHMFLGADGTEFTCGKGHRVCRSIRLAVIKGFL